MIIAITANNNSVGKSTVAQIIHWFLYQKEWEEEYDEEIVVNWLTEKKANSIFSWDIVKFSEPPANIYFDITGLDYHDLSRRDKEKERPRFIEFCEQCKNIFGNDVWVKALFDNYTKDDNWIIDDLRFPVELDRIKQEEHFIIGIVKNEGEQLNLLCDVIIVNSGTLLDLCKAVKKVLIWKNLI